MKRIVLINFLVFYLIITFFIIFSSIYIDLNKYLKKNQLKIDTRSNLPNYSNIDWATKHFQEFNSLKTEYYDYIIWRRSDFKGETIKIINNYRLNNSDESLNIKKDIWVFGGSAIWGTGVRNEDTIPSILETLSGISTFNFGESGYQTSQEFNLLMKEIVNHKPKKIIFYDGVNDIYHKCIKQSNYFATTEEINIKNKMDKNDSNYTSNLLKSSIILVNQAKSIINHFIKRIKLKIFSDKNISKINNIKFDCDINKEKAKKIAEIFVNNWILIKQIADINGIKFIPILQPTAFSSKSKLDHLSIDSEIEKQFKTMYPLIKNELKKSKLKYLNFENELNENQYFFIDFTHLSPNGNLEIAKKIINSKMF